MKGRKELVEYGETIQRAGWSAGEAIIERYEKTIPDFRCWAYAIAIMLRVEELLAD